MLLGVYGCGLGGFGAALLIDTLISIVVKAMRDVSSMIHECLACVPYDLLHADYVSHAHVELFI